MADLNSVCDVLSRHGIAWQPGVLLRNHTTFRIGGAADIFVEGETAESVAAVVQIAARYGAPLRCIGGGSNLLVSDEGVGGIILQVGSRSLSFDGSAARVGAGYDWDTFVEASVESGLAGAASMSGIPGTVGGAIFGNAGAYGESVSDRLVSATVVTKDGQVLERPAAGLGFAYRRSDLRTTGEIVVQAVFSFERGDRVALDERRQSVLETRSAKHPVKAEATAGSFFKNIDDSKERTRLSRLLALPDTGHRVAAGALLDRVGARGLRVGDAVVFEKHANIIVNRGRATAADVLSLSEAMRGKVEAVFGVRLEREVIWMGRGVPETSEKSR